MNDGPTTSGSLNSPLVAKLAARALIKHSMNASAAARELRPHLTEGSARKFGQRMLRNAAVQAALEHELAPRGMDERSRDRYVAEMWSWLYGPDEPRKLAAARILGRAFIGSKVDTNDVVELRISGFEEGVRYMLSDPENESESDARHR